NKRRIPAASLIQSAWRCFAASANFNSNATWNEFSVRRYSVGHDRPLSNNNNPLSTAYFTMANDQGVSDYAFEGREFSKQPSKTHKNVIRFIRVLKFYLARRHFQAALRPYDIQDVMQQYSEGHCDVMNRVRVMQSGIDTAEQALYTMVQAFQMM